MRHHQIPDLVSSISLSAVKLEVNRYQQLTLLSLSASWRIRLCTWSKVARCASCELQQGTEWRSTCSRAVRNMPIPRCLRRCQLASGCTCTSSQPALLLLQETLLRLQNSQVHLTPSPPASCAATPVMLLAQALPSACPPLALKMPPLHTAVLPLQPPCSPCRARRQPASCPLPLKGHYLLPAAQLVAFPLLEECASAQPACPGAACWLYKSAHASTFGSHVSWSPPHLAAASATCSAVVSSCTLVLALSSCTPRERFSADS
jgi:hypothetical protein